MPAGSVLRRTALVSARAFSTSLKAYQTEAAVRTIVDQWKLPKTAGHQVRILHQMETVLTEPRRVLLQDDLREVGEVGACKVVSDCLPLVQVINGDQRLTQPTLIPLFTRVESRLAGMSV